MPPRQESMEAVRSTAASTDQLLAFNMEIFVRVQGFSQSRLLRIAILPEYQQAHLSHLRATNMTRYKYFTLFAKEECRSGAAHRTCIVQVKFLMQTGSCEVFIAMNIQPSSRHE